MLCQILMLENAHANGIAVLTVNKEFMHQFTFDRKTKLTINVDCFFILFIDDQIKLIKIKYGKAKSIANFAARVAKP